MSESYSLILPHAAVANGICHRETPDFCEMKKTNLLAALMTYKGLRGCVIKLLLAECHCWPLPLHITLTIRVMARLVTATCNWSVMLAYEDHQTIKCCAGSFTSTEFVDLLLARSRRHFSARQILATASTKRQLNPVMTAGSYASYISKSVCPSIRLLFIVVPEPFRLFLTIHTPIHLPLL
jgi:hypothetical protein